jgi:hypothetical protein
VNDFERRAIDMLLKGCHPVLAVLRAQLEVATVSNRQITGVGFFTHFVVPPTVPRLTVPGRVHFGDVQAEVPGLAGGAGFVLFLKEGSLECLECYTYGVEQFPSEMESIRLYYVRPGSPGSIEVMETAERDLSYALAKIA